MINEPILQVSVDYSTLLLLNGRSYDQLFLLIWYLNRWSIFSPGRSHFWLNFNFDAYSRSDELFTILELVSDSLISDWADAKPKAGGALHLHQHPPRLRDGPISSFWRYSWYSSITLFYLNYVLQVPVCHRSNWSRRVRWCRTPSLSAAYCYTYYCDRIADSPWTCL